MSLLIITDSRKVFYISKHQIQHQNRKWKTLLKQPNGHGNSSSNNGGNSSEDRIYDGGSDKHHKQIHQTCYTRVSLFITEIFTSILGYIIDIHSSKLTVAARILHAGLQHGNSQR